MKDLVRRYIKDNYYVEEDELDSTLADSDVNRIIETAIKMGSYPYYPGDEIAKMAGWEGIDEPDDDAYDGCPVDDEDTDDED